MKLFVSYIILILSPTVFAQQHQNANMYLHYDIPPNEYYNLDQEITPQKLAPGTFWALTFGFNELNNGGYIGVQTSYSDTTKGMFIFSIWNAIDAVKGDPVSYTVNFDGEGSGKSCRISIPLVGGHGYKLKVRELASDSTGTYWGAWIMDQSIGKEYALGKIKTDEPCTLSNSISNFVEYYGDEKPCDKVPSSTVVFHPLNLNCDDNLRICDGIYNPINYHFADCVDGYSVLTNSSFVFFGSE